MPQLDVRAADAAALPPAPSAGRTSRARLSWARTRPKQAVDDALLLPESSSPVTSEGRSRSSSARAPRCASFASAAAATSTAVRARAWEADDSPLSSDAVAADLARKSSLPRCAVVHFRREGNVVRWTPRARENTGGIAARTRDFDDAFQLEELSSRTFAFAKHASREHDHATPAVARAAEAIDVSFALAAAAAAGLKAPPPPPPRGPLRRFAARLRRRAPQPIPPPARAAHVRYVADAAAEATAARQAETAHGDDQHALLRAHASAHVEPTARRSLSTGDIRAARSGCLPRSASPKPLADRACTGPQRPRRTLNLLFRRRAVSRLVDADVPSRTAPPPSPREPRDARKMSSLSSWNLRRSSAPAAWADNPAHPSSRANDPYVNFMDAPPRR